MITQACNLAGRIPAGPIYIQRLDGTAYCSADEVEINRMVKAGVVEGIGPRSGVIRRLRMVFTEAEALKRIAEIPLPKATEETPGSITSAASRTVYKEHLGESGRWCWNHMANRNLSVGCAA